MTTNLAEQYRAATLGAAMFDVSDRALIEMTGGDRASFLHNFCTSDINKLQDGECCEAFLTNVKGRILGHILVFAEQDALWISSDPGTQSALMVHLDRYIITEDVELADRTDHTRQELVCGPRAVPACEDSLASDSAYRIRRVPLTNVPGFLIATSAEHADRLRTDLESAGASRADAEVLEVLRIETVWPRYGVDITEENIAQEAGRTPQAISFTKGCYLGQEPIARLDALGHTNRELRGIRFEEPAEVAVGATVLDAAGSAEVGTITSAAVHPVTNRPLALAMLKTAANAAGTSVRVPTSDGRQISGAVFCAPTASQLD